MEGLGLLTRAPGDIWTIIIMKLQPKEAVSFAVTVNKSLGKFLREKVKWQKLLDRDYWMFVQSEKACQKAYLREHPHWPQYDRVLRQKSPFKKYYLLLKDDYTEEKIMPSEGTCDSPQQLAKRFPRYSGIVYMWCELRCNQPKEYGWRWHKWGEYYGELRPKSPGGYSFEPEYLRQANGRKGMPRIDEAWIFSRHDKRRGERYVFDHGIAIDKAKPWWQI